MKSPKLRAAIATALLGDNRAQATGLLGDGPGRIAEEHIQAVFRGGLVVEALELKCRALAQSLRDLGFKEREGKSFGELKPSGNNSVQSLWSMDFYDDCQERDIFLWVSLYVQVQGPAAGRFQLRGQVVRRVTDEERKKSPLAVADVMVDQNLFDSGVPQELNNASTDEDMADFALEALGLPNWPELARSFAAAVDRAITP